MKMMIKIVAMTILAGTMVSCYVDMDSRHDDHSHTTVYYSEQRGLYFHDLACYVRPYDAPSLWCDLYPEAECCTWYVDGWYEEWCDWDFNGCWEYNRSF